jgi:S-DNA-T family DNA segregation ATPase FtsK/SpoIIIE
MSDTNRKNGGAANGAGRFWVKWFDPRALTVLGVMLIALCCVAAVIALWANNAAQPIAITRPGPGAALELGRLGDSEGTSAPGAQIKLYDGSLLLGEARADSSGRWNFPLPTTLGAGGRTLRADALDAANRLTSASVAWTLVDPSAVARATETRPALPPTSIPPTALPAAPAPPALFAPTFGVLPGVFPPANPLKEAPAGIKGAAYEAVNELAGTAGPFAKVRLFDGDRVIGDTTADAKGNWSIKIATPFALGPHAITAAAVDGAAVGPRSAAQAFTLVPAQIAVVVPTSPPEPTKAITPTRVVTAGVAVPAATVAPTKPPESTVTTPITATPTKAAPTAAPAATVAATKAPESTRPAPTAAPTAAATATNAAATAPTAAPTATVAATKVAEVTKAAPTAAPTAAVAATVAAPTATVAATKTVPTASPTAVATAAATATVIATGTPVAATATIAPTQPAAATKVVAQAATAAPTKAAVLTPTPRVLLGVTGEPPEAGSSLPIVIGATAVLALAAMALARRRIR